MLSFYELEIPELESQNKIGCECMSKKSSPNDNRSDSKNPNNESHKASQDNRSDQLNPNNERYQGKEN